MQIVEGDAHRYSSVRTVLTQEAPDPAGPPPETFWQFRDLVSGREPRYQDPRSVLQVDGSGLTRLGREPAGCQAGDRPPVAAEVGLVGVSEVGRNRGEVDPAAAARPLGGSIPTQPLGGLV